MKNYLVVNLTEKETAQKKPYVVLTLTDGSKEIEAKMWNTTADNIKGLLHKVFAFELTENVYNGQTSYIATAYQEPTENVSIVDYIKSAPISSEKMYSEIMDTIASFENSDLKKICCHLYTKYRSQLLYWSAARSMHHNLYGGLLYHTYRMLETAKGLTNVVIYPTINKELLMAGVILHDIGKLKELETDDFGKAEYTIEGSLLGHLYIGMNMVQAAYHETNCKDEDTLLRLLHIIAAHHGKPEWGAIVAPATLEAQLVHEIDMTDSRAYMFEDVIKETEPGTMSEKHPALGYVYV